MESRDERNVKDYWRVIAYHKWLISSFLFLSVLSAVAVNELTRPVYQATSQIMIQKEQTRSPLTGDVMESSSTQSDSLLFDTAVELVTSRTLMGRVVQVLRERHAIRPAAEPAGLMPDIMRRVELVVEEVKDRVPVPTTSFPVLRKMSEEERAETELNAEIDRLQAKIGVKPVGGTRLVNIHVQDVDPFVARTIANTVAHVFTEDQARQRLEAYKTFASYLEGQLQHVKGKIEGSEQAFYAFKDHQGLFSLEGKLKEGTKNIEDLNVSLVKTKTDRLAIEARLDKLRTVMKDNTVKRWNTVPVESQTMDALRRDLLVAQTDLARVREVYKAQHPKVKTLESAIESIQTSLREELDHAVSGLTAEHGILLSREQHLNVAVKQSEQEIHEINNKALEYSTLERELNTNRELYSLLLSKLNETDITGKIQIPIIQVTELAPIPQAPIRPRKAMNLSLSLIVGVMAGLALAFFRDHLQQTVRTPEDVSVKLKLPVLGIIPKGSSR